jgi:hypothetical protein
MCIGYNFLQKDSERNMINFDWSVTMIDPCDAIYLILTLHCQGFYVVDKAPALRKLLKKVDGKTCSITDNKLP